MIDACRLAQFDLIIIETPGIGQGNAAIVPLVDTSLYVMTPEFGAHRSWRRSTCSISPTRRHQQVRPQKGGRRLPRCQQAGAAQPGGVLHTGTRCRCMAPSAARFNDDG